MARKPTCEELEQRAKQLEQAELDLKKTEEALHRLNCELRAISHCNRVLMHAEDERALLNEVCRIVCDIAGYRMAWVGYAEHDDAKTVRPMAWAGAEEGYLAEAGITWTDTERGRGPAGRAVREEISTCIQDFATDPQAAPWRESALQRGYRSSTALPLKNESGTPFGALCIYSAEPNAFTPDEIRLLEVLAGDLAFGIATLRVQAEHKKSEMQILASEQLFRALVENSPDFIARYDREFRRIYVNPAIQKLFGGQAENALGKTPADQSPLYAPQIYIDHLRQAIETATESTAEIPFRTAQGEMHWGHMRFVPEFGPDGKVVSVLAIGRDIHEIKENEQRFRMLAENFPDFVVRFDRDGHYTYVNSAVEKAFGMSTEAIVGKTLQELPQRRTPEQNDALLALIRRAFDEGVANESEAYWDAEMGECIFEIRHVPEKDATGNVVSVLSFARDITERKRMEQDRLAHLRFFECMDQINRALQGTNDFERMMSDALDVVLSIFDCDRAFLMYPCDPEAAVWHVPMERNRPKYPGVRELGREMRMDPDVAETLRILLAADGPVKFGPGTPYALPADVSAHFGFKSFMSMAIHPKIGSPWQFGIHQCSYARVWTAEEERLLREIGRRIGDALTSILAYRDLQERKAHHSAIVEAFDGLIYVCSQDYRVEFMNARFIERTGYDGVGDLCYRALHGLDSVCPWCVNERVFKGETVRWEVKSPKDGRWYYTVNTPIHHPDGSISKQAMIIDITERKQAEEALRESEKRFRDLYENAPNAYFSIGVDGIISSCNRRAGELLGYEIEDLVGRPVMEIYADTKYGKEKAKQVLERFLAGETVWDEELEMQKADGNPVWISLTVDTVRDAQGQVVESRSMVVDVTERKRAESIMQARLRLLELANSCSMDELLTGTLDEIEALTGSTIGFYHFLESDQKTLSLQSWSTNTLKNMCSAEGKGSHYDIAQAGVWVDGISQRGPVIHNDYASLPHRKGMPEGHAPVTREAVVPIFRGTLIKAIIGVGNKSSDYAENDIEMVSQLGDLSWEVVERLRAEEALRESEDRYRTIFRNSPLGIFRTTFDGRFLEANPAAAKLFGYDFPETLIREIHNIGKQLYAHPEDRPRIISEQTSASGVTQRVNYYRRKDGSELIANLYLKTIHSAEGQPLFFEGIVEDITERKRAEEEIRKLNIELEQRVKDRTARLEAANKELEAFAYSVSHDLRAPLRHIDGFLELLQKSSAGALDERGHHYMSTISESARRMGTLIDDLLSFSRMGRYEMSKGQVDLGDLVQQVIRELGPETEGRTIRWRIGDLPVITGDCAMLRVVLVNLISNALKFTLPREKTEIEIGCTGERENETIVFVRDNGVGFDMNYADKLFAVFQRLHREDEFQGTGIGLANVSRIIARHGGRTWAEGKPDQGASFYFALPQA